MGILSFFKSPPPPPPSRFYVPYDQLKPLKSEGGEAIFIWQAFPWLKAIYTNYELEFDSITALQDYIGVHWEAPLIAIFLYALMIIFVPKIMKNRKAFDLKKALAAWNFFLAAFSFMGMIRTVPYLFYFLATTSYRELNCLVPSYTHRYRDIGFWVLLFAASKFFELIDTAFIVLRKKPLIFLHWYHHVTVLLFTYYSCANHHAGLFFVAMNYSVHAVMYFYFFLMAINKVPKWFNPFWITLAQISQMFVGVTVTASAAYFKNHGGCEGARTPLLIGSMLMYGSYFYLFVQFAVLRFIIAPRKAAAKRKEEFKTTAPGTASPPPFVPSLSMKKRVSTIAQSILGEDENGRPLVRPLITEGSYSITFEMPQDDEDTSYGKKKK